MRGRSDCCVAVRVVPLLQELCAGQTALNQQQHQQQQQQQQQHQQLMAVLGGGARVVVVALGPIQGQTVLLVCGRCL